MLQKNTKGVNISFLNAFMTTLTFIVFCFIVIVCANVNSRFQAVKTAINKFIVCEQCSKDIKESANYLTENARLFVLTHKSSYANKYLQEVDVAKKQENALLALQQVCSEKDLAYQRLQVAITQAKSLYEMELYAMRLAYEVKGVGQINIKIAQIPIRQADKGLSKEKMQEVAQNNLFGEGYLIYKKRINDNCDMTIDGMEQGIKDEMERNAFLLGTNIQKLQTFFFVLLVVDVAIFISFGTLVVFPLKKFSVSIKKDERLDVIGSVEFKNLAQSYNEIYDQKMLHEQSLLKKAEYDALTGILNRHAFEDICHALRQQKQKLGFLLIDLDNFKHINDTYGHSGGDTVLKEVAKTLKDLFRSDDFVFRIGGDEFAAVLPNFDPLYFDIIQKKIQHANESLKNMKDGIKPVSLSVGVAFSLEGFSDQLYKNADAALYEVKEHGKRGCKIFKKVLPYNTQDDAQDNTQDSTQS